MSPHLRTTLSVATLVAALLALAIALAGCAARTAPPPINVPDHYTPEHIPPWANPKTEAQVMEMMRAGQGETEEEQALRAAKQQFGPDLAEVIADNPDLTWDEFVACCFAGRPADLIPHQVPSDWIQYEDRRLAFGSSQDWVPRAMLNERATVSPVAATGREAVVIIGDEGVVFPVGATGPVCTDVESRGEVYRACLPVEELRRLLHGAPR